MGVIVSDAEVISEEKKEMSPEEREWRAQIHMAVLEETRIFLEESKQVITERAMAKLKAKVEQGA